MIDAGHVARKSTRQLRSDEDTAVDRSRDHGSKGGGGRRNRYEIEDREEDRDMDEDGDEDEEADGDGVGDGILQQDLQSSVELEEYLGEIASSDHREGERSSDEESPPQRRKKSGQEGRHRARGTYLSHIH